MRDELYHYGTLNMHWGKRNYQNEDGSYKPGAEGRYYTPVGSSKRNGLFSKIREKKAAKEEEKRKIEEAKNKRVLEEHKVRQTVEKHAGDISNQVTKMMMSDLDDWGETRELSSGQKEQLKNKISKQLKEQFKNYSTSERSKDMFVDNMGKGKIFFIVETVPEYCDSAPLEVEYDTINKKITYAGWA